MSPAGRVDGVAGPVDRNSFNGTCPEWKGVLKSCCELNASPNRTKVRLAQAGPIKALPFTGVTRSKGQLMPEKVLGRFRNALGFDTFFASPEWSGAQFRNTQMNKLIVSACFSTLIFAIPASAYSPKDQTTPPTVSEQTEGGMLLLARHGKDDGKRDDRGGKGKDDGSNHAENQTQGNLLLLARHGKDDAKGDDRGGTGKDDGSNHA